MNPDEVLKKMREKMDMSIEACKKEFARIRTGKATPALVEDVIVSYYGTTTPLKQLAGISAPEPRLLVIQPWDPTSISEIEKAILSANLGITPHSDGKVIRIQIPQLTKERREELVKVLKRIAEEGRVSVRSIRRDAKEEVKRVEKAGDLPEDERYRLQDEIQKVTDSCIEKIDTILGDKEKEIMEV